jgi:hypothetical protein
LARVRLLVLLLALGGCPANPRCRPQQCACAQETACGALACSDTTRPCTIGCSKVGDCSGQCVGAGCQYACAGSQSCNLTCGNGCSAACGGSSEGGTCIVDAGSGSNYLCQDVSRCAASLGDGGSASCVRAGSCEITCRGNCTVRCTGACRVHCVQAGHCNLACDNAAPVLCDGGAACGSC